jgi:cytoskeletal protein CcmA (bactofilin family)
MLARRDELAATRRSDGPRDQSIDVHPSSLPRSSLHRPAEEASSEAKLLIVSKGISLSGRIAACDRLVIHGSVQAVLEETHALEIAESGRFTEGRAEVEEAEIRGLYEGELTVRGRLLVCSTGQVRGIVRYGELQIERGGRLTGAVSVLDGEVAAQSAMAEDRQQE